MDTIKTLNQIDDLIDALAVASLLDEPQLADTVKSLATKLARHARTDGIWTGYMSEKFGHLTWSTDGTAGLNDGNGLSRDQLVGLARRALKAL